MTANSITASPIPRALFLLGAVVTLSHLANDFLDIGLPWGPVWKASGIVLLGLYALTRRAWVTGVALLLCAAGDVFLELDGLFVFGMAAFGLGHVGYIVCFLGWMRALGQNRRDLAVALLVVAISVGLLVWFFPDMGSLTVPGIAYQTIITLMVCTALLAKAPMAARLGAVIFMVSDSLIALGLYKHLDVVPGSVWLTYAIAQISIAWGLGREIPARRAPKAA
jgi:uncharacterized membrane protein YhhN